MIIRKHYVLLFVAILSSQLASNANDLDKLLNKGLGAGKKEAVKTFARAVQSNSQNTAATAKTTSQVTVTTKAVDAQVGTTATTATNVTATPEKKTTSSKIKEKVTAEVERNAMRYGNKYLKQGESKLTNFLK